MEQVIGKHTLELKKRLILQRQRFEAIHKADAYLLIHVGRLQ